MKAKISYNKKTIFKLKLAIIGLGYVGLPLALEFSKKFNVLAFDKDTIRINDLKKGIDKNKENNPKKLRNSKKIKFTSIARDLTDCDVYIVTVPTPITKKKLPNLKPLIQATNMISKYLHVNNVIIYESTVYPGTINEICVPLIEKISGLKYNEEFFCGYSPERINPGDLKHKLTNIKKITSGSNKQTSKLVNLLYRSIIKAGTFEVSSIKIAEAAKVIENTQRDLNIALINELSIIFNLMKLDIYEILEAASTKWNFIKFKPGLVGGHCIGIDPYYLTYKSNKLGYQPKVILAGRKINDSMGSYVSRNLIKEIKKNKINKNKLNILILGYTFKENCSDIRNSKVEDIVHYLNSKNNFVDVYDPNVNKEDINLIKNCKFIFKIKKNKYDAIIIAVAHKIFYKYNLKKLKLFCKKNHVIYDLKNILKDNKYVLKL
tara:strand:- start:1369 stop:2670 length:1302 start_codon:yes stop_codon:yes gene_type:complete